MALGGRRPSVPFGKQFRDQSLILLGQWRSRVEKGCTFRIPACRRQIHQMKPKLPNPMHLGGSTVRKQHHHRNFTSLLNSFSVKFLWVSSATLQISEHLAYISTHSIQLPFDLAVYTKLHNFYLQDNLFSDGILDFLLGLYNLECLNLVENNFSGEISPKFNNLTRLGTLYLKYNELSVLIPNLS
ncbi:hypothetical protein NE237_026391 [Protea cynaroides]|uniref:Uncharacterized protein n=1 Tax=Protea cynaroides TaxID=273540 RepID=A0A9Q0H4U7_9MAGN|nr:hypothetical protein NE237_026391 [Protea cynaroides]